MAAPGRGFGTAAAAYERYRLGYPDAVADHVLAYADGPVRTALEIGAGTGKATRLFAGRGIAVVATEPDPEMLAVLVQRCAGLPVRPLVSTLEELPPQERVDLVFVAAALHWTDDDGRWERIAALLRPGGTFASFAAPYDFVDPGLGERVAASVERWTDASPQTRRDPPEGELAWPGHELVAHADFTDVRQSTVAQRVDLPAEGFVATMATTSGYLALTPERRSAALADLRSLLPGTVALDADVILHLARRR